MNKGSHFIGQPAYGQLISLLDNAETLGISRSNGGERYVKHFDKSVFFCQTLAKITTRLPTTKKGKRLRGDVLTR